MSKMGSWNLDSQYDSSIDSYFEDHEAYSDYQYSMDFGDRDPLFGSGYNKPEKLGIDVKKVVDKLSECANISIVIDKDDIPF